MDLLGIKERKFKKEIEDLKDKLLEEENNNSRLINRLVSKERYYIGDMHWNMYNNKPTQFIIIRISIDNNYTSNPSAIEDVKSGSCTIYCNEIFNNKRLNTSFIHSFTIHELFKTKQELIESLK